MKILNVDGFDLFFDVVVGMLVEFEIIVCELDDLVVFFYIFGIMGWFKGVMLI